jgi:tetratricopeptide (TPR) repeat protein
MRGGFLWDDDQYVSQNSAVHDIDGLKRIWLDPASSPNYYPLVFTTFWMEYRLWGQQSSGYHLTNVLLHAACAALVFWVLLRLQVPGAFLAAGIFALHPVQVESVAWIAERKNVLSGLFFLLALAAWVRFLETRRHAHYLWVCAAFLAAMLSKTVACTLPAVLLLVTWYRGPGTWKRELVRMLPLFAGALIFGLLTIWWEKEKLGAAEAASGLSFLDRLLAAGRIPWFYLWKLVWPADLLAIYPQWNLDPGDWTQYLFVLAAAGLLLMPWVLRKRLGNGPFVCSVYFLIVLGPALSFIDFSTMDLSLVADHYQYLASLGPIVLFAGIAASLGSKKTAVAGVPLEWLVFLLPLGLLTAYQAGFYKSAETLWRHTISGNPQCWAAHNNLGVALSADGEDLLQDARELKAARKSEEAAQAKATANQKFEQAIEAYEDAARLKPGFGSPIVNIGNALIHLGKPDEAIKAYERAFEAEPGSSLAHFKLGRLYSDLRRPAESVVHLKKALELKPRYPEALNSLGVVAAQQGNFEDAAAYFEQVLQIHPYHKNAIQNLAYAREDLDSARQEGDEKKAGMPPDGNPGAVKTEN